MLVRVLLSILPLLDQLSAHWYYGQICIPDSQILLPYGRCFCNIYGRINLCEVSIEREDMVRRSEPEKSKIGRIVGGEDTNIDQYPFILALEVNGQLICGATIISDDWAISAAHCFANIVLKTKCYPQLRCKVRAGSSKLEKDGYVFDVGQVSIHEEYGTDRGQGSDIAVFKVNKPFSDASKTLITAKLPDKDYEVSAGTMVTVIGWGMTEELGDLAKELQEVKVPIVDTKTCKKAYGSNVNSHMICAGYPEGKKDSCQGDSGGPLVINNTLIGLVSFGAGCAQPNSPGVYTKVASYRDWIKKHAGV